MLKEEGKNPFILDSKAPTASFRDFLLGEVRYSSLAKAGELFGKAEKDAKEKFETYENMAKE